VFRIAALCHVPTDCLLEVVESFSNKVRLQAQLRCQSFYSLLAWSIQHRAEAEIMLLSTKLKKSFK